MPGQGDQGAPLWHADGDVIPEGLDVDIGLEEAASQLSRYEQDLVPGIPQTRGSAVVGP